MNIKFYDPVVGRFLSPDNYVQAPENTQSFNRYSYLLNNPLKYTDMTGDTIDYYSPQGWYINSKDNKSEYITGVFYRESKFDEKGNIQYSKPLSFDYNDLEDRNLLIGGEAKIAEVVNSDFVYKSSREITENIAKENKFIYAERESRPKGDNSIFSGKSNGKLDLFSNNELLLKYNQKDIIIMEDKLGYFVGYNEKDFGNFLWGHAMMSLGFTYRDVVRGSNINNFFNSSKDNAGETNFKWTPFDSQEDQRAIFNGYYLNTNRTPILAPQLKLKK